MKKIIFPGLIALFLFTACNKLKDEISLKGEWTVDNISTKGYRSGSVNTITEPGDGYKYNFQDNGNLLITGFLTGSTVPSILPNSKVEIDGDVYEIRNLTASAATLFIRQDYNPDEYDELYINLKR